MPELTRVVAPLGIMTAGEPTSMTDLNDDLIMVQETDFLFGFLIGVGYKNLR